MNDLDRKIRAKLDEGQLGHGTINGLPAPIVYIDALRAVLDLVSRPKIMGKRDVLEAIAEALRTERG